MLFNGANLLAAIFSKYNSRADFAEAMGMSKAKFLRRLKDGSFTLDEIEKARALLDIPPEETSKYFTFFG